MDQRKRRDRKSSAALTLGGLLLIAAALFLSLCNVQEGERAAEASEQAVRQISALVPATAPTMEQERAAAPDKAPEEETVDGPHVSETMPEVEAEGQMYIGVLRIPALSLELPVISQWSEEGLRTAPCRYKGSVYEGDLIIAGHNYRRHFAGLYRLKEGDAVSFTDMESRCFSYRVSQVLRLDGGALEEMEAGKWDLTLFTCTLGGRDRVTVRCQRAAEDGAE